MPNWNAFRVAAPLVLAGLMACTAPPPLPPPLFVHVVRIKSEDGRTAFHATGDVHARVESNLSFRVAGKVKAKLFDVGDHVGEGAVLARLDSEEQRADVSVAQAAVASAVAALDRSSLELARERTLFAHAVTTKASLDSVEHDHTNLKSSYAAAEAQLEMARDTLSYTELRAGRAGTIMARSADVGQVVQAGATVFTLSEDGAREAVFRVDETIANRVGPATQFTISLVDDPSVRAEGVVREVAPGIDLGTESLLIKVAITDPPAAMTLGAPVVGTLNLAATKTFTIPAAAIYSDTTEAPSVWVVDAATRVVSLRRVTVSAYETRSIVVSNGLADGDLVVTAGASRLRPAQLVRFDDVEPI